MAIVSIDLYVKLLETVWDDQEIPAIQHLHI